MRRGLKMLWSGVQYVADCIVLLACWAVWIVLGALLAIQVVIAFSHELAVPGFVLRALEERFTASHVNARFGSATFNPSGLILIENLALSLPEFDEPVANARAVFVQLDPWLLLAGKIEARRIYATGLRLSAPAILTASGRSEEMLSDLDFTITPQARQLTVDHLTARIAGVALEMHGAIQLPPRPPTESISPLPLIENIARQYVPFSRQLLRAATELAAFEQPQLQATLRPSATRGAVASVSLTARALTLPKLRGLQVQELSASLDLPLLGNVVGPSPLKLTIGELRTSDGAVAQLVHADVTGSINPAHFYYAPHTIQLTTNEVSARGFQVRGLSGEVRSKAPNQWATDLIGLCLQAPFAVQAQADLAEKTAEVNFQGALMPGLLDPISAEIGHDVRRWINFGEPVVLDVRARFQPGWKFERVTGRIAVSKVDAYRVAIDAAQGEIDFDGRHFVARHATATLGENQAWGSFEQDLSTLEFRFLLEGHLRPLEIGGWFGAWWPDFFQHFQFPAAPPSASVDVRGRWRAGYETTVFVAAQSTSPIIRDTALDFGRTIMFIRPNHFNALEFFGTRGSGEVRGSFVRTIDLVRRDWSEMTFTVDSTMDLKTGAGLLGPEMTARFEPFKFAQAPRVKASGRLDGPASPRGKHQSMEIEAQGKGGFSVFAFPADDLSFRASLRDDELTLHEFQAVFASGNVAGRARISGPDERRQLSFDATLLNANLRQAVTSISTFAATKRGRPAANADNFLPGKSQITLDLALKAEGGFDDLLSYKGSGNAVLKGAELGEVRLLGLLSDLLDFTALRFTTARGIFEVQGKKVTFPELSVTGANSAIEGHGDYLLETGEIDFKARVFPFQESKNLLQSVVGVVLMPLSTALEVKLTGPISAPSWAFVMGPTNFLRNLSQPTAVEPTAPTSSAPSPYLKR